MHVHEGGARGGRRLAVSWLAGIAHRHRLEKQKGVHRPGVLAGLFVRLLAALKKTRRA